MHRKVLTCEALHQLKGQLSRNEIKTDSLSSHLFHLLKNTPQTSQSNVLTCAACLETVRSRGGLSA